MKKAAQCAAFVGLRYASTADADRFHMPAAIIGVANPLILEPAARRRRWWLHVTGTAAIGQGPADQAADNTCSQASGNDLAGIVVVAMMTVTVAIPTWRWRSATVVPTRRRSVAPLRHRCSGRGHGRAGEDGDGEDRKSNLLHVFRPWAPDCPWRFDGGHCASLP